MKSRAAAVAIALASFVGFVPASAEATVFAAWQVSRVHRGDTLNIRKYPSAASQKQAAYPNETVLQMTGRCTGGGADLRDMARLPARKQVQSVRYRWCEVWHDPAKNGKFVTGWVYGKYIRPH